jgi:hypothetical protein
MGRPVLGYVGLCVLLWNTAGLAIERVRDAGDYLSPVFRRLTFSTDIAMVCCQDASVVLGHGRDFDQSQAVSSKIPIYENA